MFCVIFDGNCNLCVTLVRLLETLDHGSQFRYTAMQDHDALASFGIQPEDCEAGMILINLENTDQRWQGSDAAEEIGRRLPLGQVFVQAYRQLPGLKPAGDQVYEYVRDNRYALFGQRSNQYQPAHPWCSDDTCHL
jgi:predicted DCC family thiol-disulfide oxidoreductase YuxK